VRALVFSRRKREQHGAGKTGGATPGSRRSPYPWFVLGWELGTGCVASPGSESVPGFISSSQLAATADLILMLF